VQRVGGGWRCGEHSRSVAGEGIYAAIWAGKTAESAPHTECCDEVKRLMRVQRGAGCGAGLMPETSDGTRPMTCCIWYHPLMGAGDDTVDAASGRHHKIVRGDRSGA